MQEILFRAKRKDNKQWVEGSLVAREYIMDYKQEKDFDIGGWFEGQMHEIIPETVGQYIPFLEAYEGDVLWGSERDEYGSLLSSWFGFIKYDDSTGRIRIQDDLGDWYEVDDFDYDKIIGNIHDNPEL